MKQRTHEHKDHPNLRQNHRPEDKPRHGNLVAQVGRYGEEYLPDVEYVVMDNKVKIVDEQTGRILDGRRYSDGLHQAIEERI